MSVSAGSGSGIFKPVFPRAPLRLREAGGAELAKGEAEKLADATNRGYVTQAGSLLVKM